MTMNANAFITDDFLLETEYARELYDNFVRPLPIVDFHCHLPPEQIASDYHFKNMTEIWLKGDHYKWRLMRSNGIAEEFCTGDADDWEKFEKWAETVPFLLRNPAYHWTHLELRKPFGISDRLFEPETAEGIWEECNAMLATPEFFARGILEQMNVALVCTTDDPVDDLESHRVVQEDEKISMQMLPTWRPDKALTVDQPSLFNAWVTKLEAASGISCDTFEDFLEALRKRAIFFKLRGCKLADHGLEIPYSCDYTQEAVSRAFSDARKGLEPDAGDAMQYKSALMYELCVLNHQMGWAQQLHLGPLRNTNTRMFDQLGPDAGFDSVGDHAMAKELARFLDRLDAPNLLTRTIIYTINPTHNMMVATMAGNFQEGPVPGKIQFGSGWWFNDQLDGMYDQMESLSQVGLISRFVGMVTDSRSFLSFPRHDYFRRLLCNMLGNDMAKGLIPNKPDRIGRLVVDICHYNAVRYFGFDLPESA